LTAEEAALRSLLGAAMIYFERPFVRVRWNEESQCVESEWLAFAFGAPYRETLEKSLELHRQKKCPRSLSDLRKASVIVDEDARWVIDNWMPRARAAGILKFAVIRPASVVSQLQLEQMGRKGGGQLAATLGVTTQYFTDVDEARRWLTSPPGSPRSPPRL
jgi:hypothetical protein